MFPHTFYFPWDIFIGFIEIQNMFYKEKELWYKMASIAESKFAENMHYKKLRENWQEC